MASRQKCASEDSILRTIGEIYSAIGHAERWSSCLASISELLACTGANLLHIDHRSHSGTVAAAARTDPAALAAYAAYFHAVDPWGCRVRPGSLSAEQVVMGDSLISYEELKRTEFYADLGQHYGLAHSLTGVIETPSERVSGIITLNRPADHVAFDAESARLLAVLVPHLRRALTLHQRLIHVRSECSALTDAIDRLPVGAILIDDELKVTSVNRAAGAVLRQRDGLTIDAGTLRAASPALTARVARLLSLAVAVTTGEALSAGEAALALARPSGRRPFQALVLPVPRPSEHTDGAEGIAAIVFVSDPETQPQPSADLLREYFGLTPAEARFAVALAGGQPPQEIADAQGLSRATARWLTEQLRTKTGSHTQAQAVAAILQSLAILRSDRD
jgi:DNA-binding CsgD family transcriptional regulator